MSQEFGLSSFVLTATDHLAIFSMPVEQQIFVVLYPRQQLQLGALKSESLCSPFPTLCICLFPVFKYLFVFHNFSKTFLGNFSHLRGCCHCLYQADTFYLWFLVIVCL